MGNKNKTISFRVNEEAFETLREIAEERDISLSAVFRDYVDTLVAHDGQVRVVPEHELKGGSASETASAAEIIQLEDLDGEEAEEETFRLG